MEKHIRFQTENAVFALPQITDYISSSTNNCSYISCGKYRKSETHCIFHYTVSGSGETWIGDTVYQTKPGYGFLNVINDATGGYRYHRTDSANWDFIVICFDYGNARALTYEFIDRFGPIFQIDDASVFSEIEICAEGRNIASISVEENYHLFAKMLGLLLKSAKRRESTESASLSDAAKNYIAAHLTKNISVSEISERLHVSREHLSRTFKKETGESIKQYIDTQRIQYISQLLSLPELSIRQIAEKTSFSSISNFSSFVKKHSHKTPHAFRSYHK